MCTQVRAESEKILLYISDGHMHDEEAAVYNNTSVAF